MAYVELDFTKTNNIQTQLIADFPTGQYNPSDPAPYSNPSITYATPFNIAADANGNNYVAFQTGGSDQDVFGTLNIQDVSDFYGLIASYHPNGGQIGTFKFIGLDSAGQALEQDITLTEGSDVRDFYQNFFSNSINGTTTQNAFEVNNARGGGGTGDVNTGGVGTYHIDELGIHFATTFQTLQHIYFQSLNGDNLIMLGATATGDAVNSYNLYATPADTTLIGSFNSFSQAMAAAVPGNAIAFTAPGGAGTDLGSQTVAVDNLTVQGGAEFQAAFSLGTGVRTFALGGMTNASVAGNGLANKFTGSDGDNVLVGGAGNDILNGGAGNDTADYSAATGTLAVNLTRSTAQNVGSGLGNDTLSSIENVTGGGANDRLTGDGNANVLRGGAGNDLLDGGTGIDTMYGGAGDDIYYVDNIGDLVREYTSPGVDDDGLDTVRSSVSYTLGAFIENLTLTGSGAIDGTGNDLGNIITGNLAANHLIGGIGFDRLTGGAGADILEGGADSDNYYADFSDTIMDNGTTGTDTVIVKGSIALATGNGIENIATAAGTTANYSLFGNEEGNRIVGNVGDNYLKGLAGDDYLTGGDGSDRLEGGIGRDTLVGGIGADTFIFKGNDSPASGAAIPYDTISDFVSGTDTIDLDVVGSGGPTAAQFSSTSITSNSYASAFSAAQSEFADALHKAVYVAGTSDGWLFWNNDANATTPDASVRIAGGNTTTAVQRTDIV